MGFLLGILIRNLIVMAVIMAASEKAVGRQARTRTVFIIGSLVGVLMAVLGAYGHAPSDAQPYMYVDLFKALLPYELGSTLLISLGYWLKRKYKA